MTDVDIRPITLRDDFDAQLDLGQRAFGVYPAEHRASWLYAARLRAGHGLFLGAFTGETPAGAAMVHDMRPYWAGRPVGCAGVAAVKVAPEYRGRGIGRRLMTELLDLIAARGYPLSALYPATMPISPGPSAGATAGQSVPTRSRRARCLHCASRTRRRAAGEPATRTSPSAGRHPPMPRRSSGSSAKATGPPATAAR